RTRSDGRGTHVRFRRCGWRDGLPACRLPCVGWRQAAAWRFTGAGRAIQPSSSDEGSGGVAFDRRLITMRVVTIIGARPQFVKAAVVSRELVASGIDETLIHTGQHYDREMSAVFFEELGIPEPAVNLDV